MSSESCLGLWLDGPMQSWGHASRFDRRTTASHPTRSGVIGLIAAAMGIDKHASDEAARLQRIESLRMTTIAMPAQGRSGDRMMRRLEDYHTVGAGYDEQDWWQSQMLIQNTEGDIRKSKGIPTPVLSTRHYLLDARFAVLLEGDGALLDEIASALRDPKWGIWLGRKCCIPASPVVVCDPAPREGVWSRLLLAAGLPTDRTIDSFDRVQECHPNQPGSDMIEDHPVGFGNRIGERHAPRWIKREPPSN